MHVTYFFRKERSGFHSIENLFKTIIKHLPLVVEQKSVELPESQVTIYRLIRNLHAAYRSKRGICHITGDTQYIGAVLPSKRTVLTIHDVEILKRSKGLKKIFIKFFWFTIPGRRLKYFTTISQFSKSEILKYTNIPADNIYVIPNCVEVDVKPQAPVFEEKPIILHVGTKENKNLVRLAEAISGLHVKLLILGKPTHQQKDSLKRFHIDYEYHFDLTYSDVLKMYCRCTFFAFVSTYEGFGLPILEAQSVGRAVLSSNVASIPEVAGDSALLVDPFNVADIRRGVIELLENEGLRADLVKKGLQNIEKFKPDVIADQYVDLYTKMMAK